MRRVRWFLTTAAGLALLARRDILQAPPVRAEQVPAAATSESITAAGRVEPASEEIRLGAGFDGRIERVMVEEGQQVSKGQVLAIFESGELKARVSLAAAVVQARQAALERLENGSRVEQRREAEATVRELTAMMELAKAELARRAELHRQGLIARVEHEVAERDFQVAAARADAARQRAALVDDETRPEDLRRGAAELDEARATLQEAEALLEKTVLRSPIDGKVLRRHRQAGEAVSRLNESPVLTLGDCSRLHVRVEVDENDVARVHVGQWAYVRADAFGPRRFPGEVIRLGNMLGRKSIRTDEPAEKMDAKVLETLVALEPGTQIPVGMRVDVYLER